MPTIRFMDRPARRPQSRIVASYQAVSLTYLLRRQSSHSRGAVARPCGCPVGVSEPACGAAGGMKAPPTAFRSPVGRYHPFFWFFVNGNRRRSPYVIRRENTRNGTKTGGFISSRSRQQQPRLVAYSTARSTSIVCVALLRHGLRSRSSASSQPSLALGLLGSARLARGTSSSH